MLGMGLACDGFGLARDGFALGSSTTDLGILLLLVLMAAARPLRASPSPRTTVSGRLSPRGGDRSLGLLGVTGETLGACLFVRMPTRSL